MATHTVLFIGCGRLGKCFLELYTKQALFQEIVVVQPSLTAKKDFPSVHFFSSIEELPSGFVPDFIFILVKPYQIKNITPKLKNLYKTAVVLSCAAMVSHAFLQSLLPEHKIIRLMPNTGLKVNRSMTLAYANQKEEALLLDLKNIFSYSGGLYWVEKEELIEQLTPLTGSGPALFFELTLSLEKKILECGIKQEEARKLALSVLEASSALAQASPELESLIDSICSKGGVTETLLSVFTPILTEAMDQSVQKSIQKIKEMTQ